ncbi:MAG: 5-oxoprolinase subunit B family protein [Gemmataceae bacterium]
MNLVPLGDSAVLAYCVSEAEALEFTASLRPASEDWLVDVVQAYTSVALYFDLAQIGYGAVVEWLHERQARSFDAPPSIPVRSHRIPCCYEIQLDLDRVALKTGLSAKEVIRLHLETEYVVYAIGFCPGFPYLGYLPPLLCGVPRLETPRLRVRPGSVGLTGKQTGIYTEARPGGWNLIGRTPLTLVDVADGYFPLRTGDRVCFTRIDQKEFDRLKGNRLK